MGVYEGLRALVMDMLPLPRSGFPILYVFLIELNRGPFHQNSGSKRKIFIIANVKTSPVLSPLIIGSTNFEPGFPSEELTP
jgi:hypothetical protein